jgi:hypothetical protein
MDLLEITRTIQADKDHAIEAESRRRRLLAPTIEPSIAAAPARSTTTQRTGATRPAGSSAVVGR